MYRQEYSSVTFQNSFSEYFSEQKQWHALTKRTITHHTWQRANGNISFISTGTALDQNGQKVQTNQRLQLVYKLHMVLSLMNKLTQFGAEKLGLLM